MLSEANLELKVPPLLLVIVTALLMWGTARAVPSLHLALPAQGIAAGLAAGMGMAVLLSGLVSFRRAGTTVNPMKPESSSRLVVSGIYGLTRNPMYLGFLLLLLAWAFYLSHPLAFLFLPVFVLYMNRFQIEPEERALTALFHEEFMAYAARVRRWL